MSNRRNSLFSTVTIAERLNQAALATDRKLENFDPDRLLGMTEDDAVAELLVVAQVPMAPSIRRPETVSEPPTEVRVSTQQFGTTVRQKVPRYTITVPYDGDPSYFDTKPTIWSTVAHPQARSTRSVTNFACTTTDRRAWPDQNLLRRAIGRRRTVSRMVENRYPVPQHENGIRSAQKVRARVTQLRAQREINSNIGFPLRPTDPTAGP